MRAAVIGALGRKRLPGQASGGHLGDSAISQQRIRRHYGTQLSDDDKWALIEFMKVLKPGEFTKPPVQAVGRADR